VTADWMSQEEGWARRRYDEVVGHAQEEEIRDEAF